MAKKICIDAGHGALSPGKQTCDGAAGIIKEWTLNDAVCRYAAEYLKDYEVEITRTDDASGKTDVPVQTRTAAINAVMPDLSLSVHHNANTGSWGGWTGVSAFYSQSKPARDANLAKLFCDAVSKETGLKNRGALQDYAYLGYTLHMIRETNTAIPSVLCEGGFMDSTIDYPVITSAAGQRAYAKGIAETCISYLGLKLKSPGTGEAASARYEELKKQCEELKKTVNSLQITIEAIIERCKIKYQKVSDLPDWAKIPIDNLVRDGIIRGDENGNLNFSYDMVRNSVIMERIYSAIKKA